MTPDALRLLVVDDDFLFADMLPRLLTKNVASPPLDIVAVRSPEDAARAIRERPFDVVLSDFDLRAPQNGLDVLRDVGAVLPEALRILVSGHSPHEIPRAPGAFHEFLEKPMRLREMIPLFARVVEARLGVHVTVARPG